MEAQFPILCAFTPLKPGSEKFQRIPITTNVFKLGSGQHNTVVIPYKCLSKDHCLFKKVEGDWLLENCSYSCIKVNSNKLRKGQTHKLSDQDIIQLGSSNELVYKFMSNTDTRSPKRKRRKLDDNVQNDNVKKTELTRSMRSDINKNVNGAQILKEQILSEQSKREKEIYDDYAVRIEKLKGSKKNVKHQKALLKMRRNTQLELNKVKTEVQIASVMAQETASNDNHHSKDKPPKQNGQGDQRTKDDQSEARREQDRVRMKEKRELKKLRRETRRLKLDKEKKLKELEKQKARREKELQDELDSVNKKLAKERELHEKERRRADQLLNQKKEELKKVSPSTSSDTKLDMESELQCSICSELFVRATTLGCSHSFCRYCIRKWTANKKECPICRAAITSECRSIVLDSLVEKMAESEEAKKKRQELVKARDELEAKEPTTTANREAQNFLFDPHLIRRLLPMDTDSEPSGFDDSDVFSGRDENGESEYDEPENYNENSEHENEESYEGYSGESDSENEEIYDEAPENEEEEHEGNSENDGHGDENYDEGENSPTDNEDHDENDPEYNEGEESASENYEEGEPENYDEGENSEPENYDEGENSEPENYVEGEISAPDNYDEAPENEEEEHEGNSDNDGHPDENYDEGENSPTDNEDHDENDPEYNEGEESASENYEEGEPENYDEGENSEPENYDEGENSEPENYDEGENSAPENNDEGDNTEPENNDEGDNTEPENYDEGENSGPEDYDEDDNSAPENYDEGDYSTPENDGDSYADDGGDDDDDYN